MHLMVGSISKGKNGGEKRWLRNKKKNRVPSDGVRVQEENGGLPLVDRFLIPRLKL